VPRLDVRTMRFVDEDERFRKEVRLVLLSLGIALALFTCLAVGIAIAGNL